jgi:chromatin-remodeling ATPase INO80
MQKSDRTSNPMSFASILGPSNNEPSPPKQAEPKLARRTSTPSKPIPQAPADRDTAHAIPKTEMANGVNGIKQSRIHDMPPREPPRPMHPPKPRKMLSKSEIGRITAAMLTLDDAALSDVDTGDFAIQRQQYRERGRKRARQVEDIEGRKRKVSLDIAAAFPNTDLSVATTH